MSTRGSSGCEADGLLQKPQGWTVSVGDVLLTPLVPGRVVLLMSGCADTRSLELMFAAMPVPRDEFSNDLMGLRVQETSP